MKWRSLTILMACTGIMALGVLSKEKTDTTQPHNEPMKGDFSPVAVLELFTSEGCSSCPPADNLLPQLAGKNASIIPLSFHVDYWNYLGWNDPFSSSAFTARQREYVNQFRLQSAYTPQLVVNGEYELVGSNRGRAESAIKSALKENATVELSIFNVNKNTDKVSFTVAATGDTKKSMLEAMLVQNSAIMKIKAGENNGATLTHTNIVRSIASKEIIEATNSFELSIPKDTGADNWKLVVIARRSNELKVTGAVLYSAK